MRQPTKQDQERWEPTMAKVREAQRLLTEAYYLSGVSLITLDGDDETGLQIEKRLFQQIEKAQMALGCIEHPVRSDWAGSDSNVLSWR